MKLSNQAVGAVMMALQNSLMGQTDIVPVLRGFKLEVDDTGEVVVINPPMVRANKSSSPVVTTTEKDGTKDNWNGRK
tara:strand:- start:466 stop:696 length:231 start_codon:yes stop_codon:yes gene_type:complete